MAFANSIAYADVFQTVLDEQVVQESRTGFMDDNAGLIQYDGGKTVKIPKVDMTGLGNYDRNNGYPEGSVTLAYENMTMTQDRGAQFQLDKMDVNETNFAANATAIMAEFQRVHVIPEVDAYRISKIATYAINGPAASTNVENGYTPAAATVLGKLADAAAIAGDDAYILVSPDTMKQIELAIGANNISSDTFSQGGIDLRVPFYNGHPVIAVEANRMVTAIQLANLANGAGGGWSKASTALDINILAFPRYAPIGVNKLDEPKVFEPDVVQEYSGWLIDYRRYHDLWVMDNKVSKIYVNTK